MSVTTSLVAAHIMTTSTTCSWTSLTIMRPIKLMLQTTRCSKLCPSLSLAWPCAQRQCQTLKSGTLTCTTSELAMTRSNSGRPTTRRTRTKLMPGGTNAWRNGTIRSISTLACSTPTSSILSPSSPLRRCHSEHISQ